MSALTVAMLGKDCRVGETEGTVPH